MGLFKHFFVLVFFLQAHAWATKISPSQAEVISAVVAHYNSLTPAQKQNMIKAELTHVDDQKFFREHQGEFGSLPWPKLTAKGESIFFMLDGIEITVAHFDFQGRSLKVNGHALDFSPGKLHSATEDLAKFLSPATTLMDLLISPAYALAPLLVWAAWILLGLIGTGILWLATRSSNNTAIAQYCQSSNRDLKEYSRLGERLDKEKGTQILKTITENERTIASALRTCLTSCNELRNTAACLTEFKSRVRGIMTPVRATAGGNRTAPAARPAQRLNGTTSGSARR